MAKATLKMPEDFLMKLSKLGEKTDEILPRVLKAGGEIVEAKVKSNLQSIIGNGTKEDSRSTGELVSALGVSSARQDRDGNFKAAFFVHHNHRCRNGHTRYAAKTEKVGGLREAGSVCPFLVAVPTFPIRFDRGDDVVNFGFEALMIFHGHFFNDINEGVHLSIAHNHTFQSRSSRSKRLTVFHTCCPAWTLSAKKPPVLPSLDS